MDSIYDDNSDVDTKAVAVARRVVRFLLSRTESQSTIISKNALQNVIRDISRQENCERVPFDVLIQQVSKILEDVFGYELQRLADGGNSTSKAQRYILLNTLKPLPGVNELLIDMSQRAYEHYVAMDQNSTPCRNTLDNDLHDEDLAFKGVLSVVLCIILFSKNHILQQELLSHLESFGIPIDGTKIPILNCTIDELLKTMDKREYLSKIQDSSDIQGETISYRIGKRTQSEFGLDSLVLLVQSVMGLSKDQYPSLKDDIAKNIADSYKSSNSI